ncbi:MAG: hypothetical protein GEU74_11535, partial [Nitriliruptorales bacterium]|nr:hypothetical protein [Nitriliruptorales bacterium]
VAVHANAASGRCELRLHHLGGAIARVPPHGTAFAQRQAPFLLSAVARSSRPDDDAHHDAWAAAACEAVAADSAGTSYLNLTGQAGESQVRAAYPDATYARLVAVKDRFDPDNVFHLNHNIRPSPQVEDGPPDVHAPSIKGEQP